MNLSFRDLNYFLTVVELGHVGRTAAVLGISQSTLSKALQRIETQTGLILFNRTQRQLQLSSVGILFEEYARRLYTEFEEALRQTHALKVGHAGLLRIGTTPVVLDTWVMPTLSWLMPKRPALHISLSVGFSDELCEQVGAGELDIAVVPIYMETLATLEALTIQQDELSFVVCDTHPLLSKSHLCLEDTLAYRWILPKQKASAYHQLLQDFYAQGLPPPVAALEVPSISSGMLTTVAVTDFISFAPKSLLKKQDSLPIKALNLSVATSRKISLITRKGTRWTPLMEAFHSAIQSFSPAS